MQQALTSTKQKNRRKSSALNEFIKNYKCARKEKNIKYAKELKKKLCINAKGNDGPHSLFLSKYKIQWFIIASLIDP